MGNLGGGEILVILLIGLIILGPKRLPEASKQVGKTIRQVRQTSRNFQAELEAAIEDPSIEEAARQKGREMLENEKKKNSYSDDANSSEDLHIESEVVKDEDIGHE
ncbi:MAG: Sec-independent protein translocase protein TatB [Acidimicrobiales bacterium]|nr:Sec-independent protein translocase protein TatB [Acidimicrobiales bacterium]